MHGAPSGYFQIVRNPPEIGKRWVIAHSAQPRMRRNDALHYSLRSATA